MKLRNKETMEIREAEAREDGIYLYDRVSDHWWKYELELLARGWEYYIEPKEPKLEGEVREIVRRWANLHGYDWLRVGFDERATQTIFWVESPDTRKHVEFLGAYVADDFDAGKYTVDELCGKKDE
jgi:hypothetical protein